MVPKLSCLLAASQASSGRFLKQAAGKLPPVDPGTQSNIDALKKILGLSALMFGIGATGRSLMGMKELVRRPEIKPTRIGPRPTILHVPTPPEDEEEEAILAAPSLRPRLKLAVLETAPSPDKPVALQLPGGIYINPQGEGEVPPGGYVPPKKEHSFAGGAWTTNPMEKPWYLATALGLSGAGLYGGYKLADLILDWRRRRDAAKEIEEAKEDYRKSLLEQYDVDRPTKRASADPDLAEDLDALSEFVKTAALPDWMPNWLKGKLGLATNMYLPIAGMLALTAGLGAYHYAKRRSPEERLAKAIKQRERLRWAVRPPEIYAVPEPLQRVRAEEPSDLVDEEKVAATSTTGYTQVDKEANQTSKIASLYKP